MPFKDPAKLKAYQDAYHKTPQYKAQRRKDMSGVAVKPFVGVDGEGGTLIEGSRQEYLLLRAGEQAVETGKPLTPWDCLAFLADLPPDVTYVSYFFDYDVTMIVRDLPELKVKRLLDREARRSQDENKFYHFPVDVKARAGHFQIDYIPHKEFRVRRFGGPWVVINDTGTFFQASFVKTLRAWLPGSPDIEKIAEGKERRNAFGAMDTYEREYNLLEVRMLARLMENFRDVCTSLNIPVRTWQGPGNIASALFRKYNVPRKSAKSVVGEHVRIHLDYPAVRQMGNDAYYGGRFEACKYGIIDVPVYQYDINSAYANTYRSLPCMVHGKWELVDSQPDEGIYFGKIAYDDHLVNQNLGFFPIRTPHGTIQFTRTGVGVYTSPELELARKYAVHMEWMGGYRYVPQCGCDPFHWVPELYSQRKALGKDVRGRVLKIALASIYGKLAQSIGDPVYSNPVWASLITGTVRATLLEAALQVKRGRDVIMLATDGLFCEEPRDLSIGSQLGQWDLTIHEPGMMVVQSGLYFLPGTTPKTRGVPMVRLLEKKDEFYAAWKHYAAHGGDVPQIPVQLRTFTGIRMAHHRGKIELAGTWADTEKLVRVEWRTKRSEPYIHPGTQTMLTKVKYEPPVETRYYDKDIGNMVHDIERMIQSEQPDWTAEYLEDMHG